VAAATEAVRAISSMARVVMIPARLIRFSILLSSSARPSGRTEFS
jgi:hypothetical protein